MKKNESGYQEEIAEEMTQPTRKIEGEHSMAGVQGDERSRIVPPSARYENKEWPEMVIGHGRVYQKEAPELQNDKKEKQPYTPIINVELPIPMLRG